MLLSLRSLWEASGGTLQVTGQGDGVGGSSATLLSADAITGSSAGTGTSTGILAAQKALTGSSAGVGGGSGNITTAGGPVTLQITGSSGGVGGSSATLTVSAALSGSSAGIGASSGVLTAAEALTGLSAGVGGSSGAITQTGGVVVDTGGGRLPLIIPRRVKAPLPPLVKTRIQLPEVAEVTVRSDDDAIVALYVAGALDLEEFAALIAA